MGERHGEEDWQRRTDVLVHGWFRCTGCSQRVTLAPEAKELLLRSSGRAPALCEACRLQRQRERSRRTSQEYRERNREPIRQRICGCCHQPFTPQSSTAQFCSTRCRVAAHRQR